MRKCHLHLLADPGVPGTPHPGQFFFIFLRFLGKAGQDNRLASYGWRRLLWEILDSPLLDSCYWQNLFVNSRVSLTLQVRKRKLIRRFGRRRTILFVLAITIPVRSMLAFAVNYVMFVAANVLLGMITLSNYVVSFVLSKYSKLL